MAEFLLFSFYRFAVPILAQRTWARLENVRQRQLPFRTVSESLSRTIRIRTGGFSGEQSLCRTTRRGVQLLVGALLPKPKQI
jgi:hypothetical protein